MDLPGQQLGLMDLPGPASSAVGHDVEFSVYYHIFFCCCGDEMCACKHWQGDPRGEFYMFERCVKMGGFPPSSLLPPSSLPPF
jgi:hypothetical protein